MQLHVAILLASISLTNGFLITNCASGVIHNFGDDACHEFPVRKVSFQSDEGCILHIYKEAACNGDGALRKIQNKCTDLGSSHKSVKCINGEARRRIAVAGEVEAEPATTEQAVEEPAVVEQADEEPVMTEDAPEKRGIGGRWASVM